MPDSELVQDLKDSIARGKALFIVGAGVSIGATNNNPVASWNGLLHHGINRCKEVGQPRLGGKRASELHESVDSGDMLRLIGAAEEVAQRLGYPKGGEYCRWLRETVGALKPENPSVLEALRELNVPIATTNYDGLLENFTERPAVTWMDGARIHRVIRGDELGTLYLHGHWQRPESVVLGVRSYETVLGNELAQHIQRTLATVKTLVFVGCGAGLRDPNFGALLDWINGLFLESEYRHYRLCLESEMDALLEAHEQDGRVYPLPFGEKLEDLPEFLRYLAPSETEPRPEADWRPTRLPACPHCFGREHEVGDLVETVLADTPEPTVILGGPGIGKTTISLVALHYGRVTEVYGPRRWFVRCDGAKSADALMREIARAIGLRIGPNLKVRLFMALEKGKALLVLDNAETPWEAQPLKVEELLSELAAVSTLALVASIRGQVPPMGIIPWREPIRVVPLRSERARELFLNVAGARFADDPLLEPLLRAVDGVPLALTLLAHACQTYETLEYAWKRYQDERTAMLQRGERAADRLHDVAVSLELSIQGPRMTDEARRLLALLAVLPEGIHHADLSALLPDGGERAFCVLASVGLAFEGQGRIRALAPIRDYVVRAYPPEDRDECRAIAYYANLAKTEGPKVGAEGGARAVERLTPEVPNIEAMVHRGLDNGQTDVTVEGAIGLSDFIRFTGIGTPSILKRAREKAHASGDTAGEALCIRSLGDIFLDFSDHLEARNYYEEARRLYEGLSDLKALARCIRSLGDIALERSEHIAASEYYIEARAIYEILNDPQGQATCIEGLGDIAPYHAGYDDARRCYEEAGSLYERAQDVLGQANCIWGLGDIASRRSDYDAASQYFSRALPLYTRIGDVVGHANCVWSLGDVACARRDYAQAIKCYEEALPLCEQVGDILGQANCVRGLGHVSLAKSEHKMAADRFEAALPMYREIGNVQGEAECYSALGDLAFASSDTNTARAEYGKALPLFRDFGDLRGEAHCARGIGDADAVNGNTDDARTRYEEALELYARIPRWESMGYTHLRFVRIARDGEARRTHIEAARDAWRRIDRLDLISELDEEFGATV